MSPLSVGRNASLHLEHPSDASTFLGRAWSNLQKFMRELHDFHQILPDLPRQSYAMEAIKIALTLFQQENAT